MNVPACDPMEIEQRDHLRQELIHQMDEMRFQENIDDPSGLFADQVVIEEDMPEFNESPLVACRRNWGA